MKFAIEIKQFHVHVRYTIFAEAIFEKDQAIVTCNIKIDELEKQVQYWESTSAEKDTYIKNREGMCVYDSSVLLKCGTMSPCHAILSQIHPHDRPFITRM